MEENPSKTQQSDKQIKHIEEASNIYDWYTSWKKKGTSPPV